MYEYIKIKFIKQSDMRCKKCIFGVPKDALIECRAFPETVLKDPDHWCANGMWETILKVT